MMLSTLKTKNRELPLQYRVVSLFAILCVLAGITCWSQEARGTIVGRISDSTGAVIPGVQVVVTNLAMGTKLSLKTNEVGLYEATYLIPGSYEIEATARGFKRIRRDGIQVQVNDRLEVNLRLELGAATESVTVTAEAPLLNTSTASTGTVVDPRRLADLPIEYGNPFGLIALAGGIAFTGNPRFDRPTDVTHTSGYAMDGTRSGYNDITVDGAPTTARAGGVVSASYVPPTDIVAEFKVQTATFDASLGQTEGGVTNISIKSGTNTFHGTGYYSITRPSFWANDFFGNAIGRPRGTFTYNQWGGSLGGPVFLPKIYNGKNKTFFLWGYEGIHDSRPRNDGTPTVPTPAMKTGDFSALLALGSAYQVYNPFTRTAAAGGRYQEQPFPGNLIPPSLINPVGRAILGYYPSPTSIASADGTNNLQQPDLPEQTLYYNHTARVDHIVNDKQRMFVRASVYSRTEPAFDDYFHNIATAMTFQFLSRQGVFDDVYTLTPTTVLNVRYSYNRFIWNQGGLPAAKGFDLATLGFPKSYNDLIPASIRRFPQIVLSGYQGTGYAGINLPFDTHSVAATLMHQRGSHSIRTGMEFRAYRENENFANSAQTGYFAFDATWTRGPLDNSAAAPGNLGQSVAGLLLGLPTSNSYVAVGTAFAEQSLSWGFFTQDDWKVTNKLTLNLGLRWEFEQPMTERFNRSVKGFDFSYVQPFSVQAQANYANNPTPEIPVSQFVSTGGLTFAGVNGQSRGLYNTPKRNLMPRFGLAYQVGSRTVLHGGYGIFYGFLGERRGDVIQSGFSRQTPFVPSQDNGLTFLSTLSNPWSNGILAPVGAGQGLQTLVGANATFFNQHPLMPQMQRWEFGIQHEFKGFLAEADYIGNKGTHIEFSRTLDAMPNEYLSTLPTRDTTTINYLSANLPNPFVGLMPEGAISTFTSATIARQRLLLAYPEFNAVNTTSYQGYSWYHSLQLKLEKRFSKGYTVLVNYTFSKFMQATELLNPGDPQPTRVISDQDVPHRLSVSGILEFPFGKNRRFLSNLSPLVLRMVGGWQVSGILTHQSGFPLSWGNYLYYGTGPIVLPSDQRSLAKWFNTSGFETASAKQLASNVRTFPLRFPTVRGESVNNFDFSLIKNTLIREGKNLQFRVEALNAFNHPLFPAANTNPTALTFGQIIASTQANYPRRLQLALKFVF